MGTSFVITFFFTLNCYLKDFRAQMVKWVLSYSQKILSNTIGFMLIKVTFGNHLRVKAGCQETNLKRRVEIWVLPTCNKVTCSASPTPSCSSLLCPLGLQVKGILCIDMLLIRRILLAAWVLLKWPLTSRCLSPAANPSMYKNNYCLSKICRNLMTRLKLTESTD